MNQLDTVPIKSFINAERRRQIAFDVSNWCIENNCPESPDNFLRALNHLGYLWDKQTSLEWED